MAISERTQMRLDQASERQRAREPHDAYPRVWLRCVDPGTDCECWVVCSKGDPGAVAFLRED